LSIEKVSDFEDIEKLANSLEKECFSGKPHSYSYVSPILFRGHSRASWGLETTLERYGKKNLSLEAYLRYLSRVKPAIESFTDRAFSFHFSNGSTEGRTFILSDVSFLKGQYEFMVYLRHHGFPTPLLDWTRSLYVALYFACSGPMHDEDSVLYMYVENLGYGKGGLVGGPEITTLGQYVTAHKRHFIQQSNYTACIAEIDSEWCFHPHEAATGTSSDTQDRIYKVLIPSHLRRTILRRLDSMNINAFSLFGTEEALMETLAFRELHG